MDRDRDREQERLVFVIRTTNIVETKMKRVIAAFIKAPSERSSFVDSYLLNNATVPFGAKVKLVLAISRALSVKVNRDAGLTPIHRTV